MFDDDRDEAFESLLRPFWFLPEGGLLDAFWHAEAKAAAALIAQCPEVAELLDTPEATLAQRFACLSLLYWRDVLELIAERFAVAYQEAPALVEPMESRLRLLFRFTIPTDAPAWTLEVRRALGGIRGKIAAALPRALQQAGGDPNDAKRITEVRAAQQKLDTPERLHELLEGVLQAQWRRLARRWNAQLPPPVELAASAAAPGKLGFEHSRDFRSCRLGARSFSFTSRQMSSRFFTRIGRRVPRKLDRVGC